MAKQKKNYAYREAYEFNKWRSLFQFIVCKIGYNAVLRLVYRMEVHGVENIPEGNDYIICPNHLSTIDPPMMETFMPKNIAFMAKKELFDIPLIRWWIDWLGAFAVDRGNLAPSTVKTVKQIKKSKNWVFGIFPQGTRQEPGIIKNVGKGFAGLARMTKCNVLPIGIIGTNEKKWLPFSGKIIIRVGKIIPYSEDLDAVRLEWIKQIEELTGFKYIEEDKQEELADGGLDKNEQE